MGKQKLSGYAVAAVWPPFVPYYRVVNNDDFTSYTYELLTVPITGGGPQTLLKTIVDGSAISYPVAAPDYSKVAWLEGDFSSKDLHIADPDGTNDEILATDVGMFIDWHPAANEVLTIKPGVGIVRVDLNGNVNAYTVPGGTGVGRGQFSPDGSRIAYWDMTSDDVRAVDYDDTNNDLLDSAPGATAQEQRLSYARAVNMVGYGTSLSTGAYFVIHDDGTGLTECDDGGLTLGNPILTHTCWDPTDSYFVAQSHNGIRWVVTKFYADGTTPTDDMTALEHGGWTGHQAYVFGDRIWWGHDDGNGPGGGGPPNGFYPSGRGVPLKSCALDGSDVQVEDDCAGQNLDGDYLAYVGFE